jgi:hypothetical protein
MNSSSGKWSALLVSSDLAMSAKPSLGLPLPQAQTQLSLSSDVDQGSRFKKIKIESLDHALDLYHNYQVLKDVIHGTQEEKVKKAGFGSKTPFMNLHSVVIPRLKKAGLLTIEGGEHTWLDYTVPINKLVIAKKSWPKYLDKQLRRTHTKEGLRSLKIEAKKAGFILDF